MIVLYDKDADLRYEVNSPGRSLFNFFFIPLLNALPSSASSLVKRSHKSVGEVINNATTHHALELLYLKGRKEHTRSLFERAAHTVWFNTNNSKAVRNRLKLTKRELKKLMLRCAAEKRPLSILSIASGSARAIVESIQESGLDAHEGLVRVTFLDKNPRALEYSKSLVSSARLSKVEFTWVEGSAGTYVASLPDRSFDLIEMVGLIDYFDDGKCLSLFRDIHRIMREGGLFITANIVHNSEERFLSKTVRWNMIYRTGHELASLLARAGFSDDRITAYYEPLRIHAVATSIK